MSSINSGTINNMLDQIVHAASVSSDADAGRNDAADLENGGGNTIVPIPPPPTQPASSSSPRSSSNDNSGSGSTGFVAMVRKSITRRISSNGSIVIQTADADVDAQGEEQDHHSKENQGEGQEEDARTVHSDSEDEYDDISIHNNNDDGSESDGGSDGDIEATAVTTISQKRLSIATEQHQKSSSRRIYLVFVVLALVVAITIGLVVGLRDDENDQSSYVPSTPANTIDPDVADPATATTSRTDTPISTNTTNTTNASKPSIPPLNLNDLTSTSSSSFLRPDKDRLQTFVHGGATTTTSTEEEDELEQKEESEIETEEPATSESCVPINPCDTDPTSTEYSFDEESVRWQCLVGYDATDAEQLILEHYPTTKFTIVILPEFSPITMDLRRDRIRIFTSKQGCVNKVPYIG